MVRTTNGQLRDGCQVQVDKAESLGDTCHDHVNGGLT